VLKKLKNDLIYLNNCILVNNFLKKILKKNAGITKMLLFLLPHFVPSLLPQLLSPLID